MTLHFKQAIRAHLSDLEGATAQVAEHGPGKEQTEAALRAARNALATVEAFLQSRTAE